MSDVDVDVEIKNHLPEDFDLFEGEPLSKEIWQNKYRFGDEQNFQETAERVVQGVYAKDDSIVDQTEAFQAMSQGLWMPGGRILAGAGTDKRVTLFNCLSGDTRIPTEEYGNITLRQAAQLSPLHVLTRRGWLKAEIRDFGEQELQKITFQPGRAKYRRKEVIATKDHRWLLQGAETTNLHVGDKVISGSRPLCSDLEMYERGIVHGIFFGDGQYTRTTQRAIGTHHHQIRALGRVKEAYEILDRYCSNYTKPASCNGDRIYYHHGELLLKELPEDYYLTNLDYMSGFIMGWWLADGHEGEGYNSLNISSTNYKHLDWLVENAQYGGYVANGDRVIGKKATNLGIAKDPCRCITLTKGEHLLWTVKDIEPVGKETVYCAIVPEEHAFCLTEGLYTGNCYVNETLDDSMEGIHRGYGNVMFTMQQGGGIGTDFTPLRPDGAWLRRTQAQASGPLPFMVAQDAIGQTVESAGERRGAQMGTLADYHPDLPKFIELKHTKGVLEQFNVSILVSDAFMAAVAEGEQWALYHAVPPKVRKPELEALDFIDEETGLKAYVYDVWDARELWDKITRSTYEYSEPGVIFIDRVNELNNLWYREQIRCTNPCGEQPLPPWACCNLGAANVALMVKNPFTDDASFDWELLRKTTHIGTRFLDNVTDVTLYPLEKQRLEQAATRRIGLGFSGLSTAMAFMGIRYGSSRSARFAGDITKAIATATYEASVQLAEERGAFPEYDEEKFWHNNHSFAATHFVDQAFYCKPLRNGVLNTIAPTGTTSVGYGNVDSGIEPIWALEYDRKVRQRDNTYQTKKTRSLTARVWNHIYGDEDYPKHIVTAMQLKVHEHVLVQEACQQWIDASISKTINIPKEMPYEEFVEVYNLAYESGLKGCTTYRESEVRGSILGGNSDSTPKIIQPDDASLKRPSTLVGLTSKVPWPALNSSAYVTLTRLENGQPYEVFLSSKDQRNNEWMTTATLFMSWLLRMGVPLKKVAEELEQVHSLDGYIVEGRYRPSLVSFIGTKLKEMDEIHRSSPETDSLSLLSSPTGRAGDGTDQKDGYTMATGRRCKQCNSPRIVVREGCEECIDCGSSKCQ